LRPVRVYADTSVFGGCCDAEFQAHSRAFFDEVRAGRFMLVLSATTLRELAGAPEAVRQVLAALADERVEVIDPTPEIETLRDAYVAAGVVGPPSLLDAEHIAAASVAEVDVIVSWNFKHIVHYEKIRGYHGVNLLQGYPLIAIHTPRELVTP
jgi:hypothetical protein